jgi:cytochrome c peroxidase
LLAGYVLFSCREEEKAAPAAEKGIAQTLLTQVDSFAALCSSLRAGVEGGSFGGVRASGNVEDSSGSAGSAEGTGGGVGLRALFLQARLAFKRFEWAAEYFEPAASRTVNGPPVKEVELSGVVIEPGGLQVIEGLLYPAYDTVNKSELLRQLSLLERGCVKYKTHFENIDILDWQVFDAVKLEVFRIETLGITGFDNLLSLKSMTECAASLGSVRDVLGHYDEGVRGKFDTAVAFLGSAADFNSFDRAAFITAYGNPITTAITASEERLKIAVTRYNRLLNQDAKTLFDTAAFNVNAYAPDESSFISPAKIALGQRLFADPGLSGDGTRSCQSCHQPGKAFTDGLVKNTDLGSKQLLARNTPTLLNAALQPSQFYDLRVRTLEDQSLTVVQNTVEMHGSMKLSVQRLWQDTGYRRLFAAAFPRKDRAGIDTLEVMNALGSFVRSLVFLNSRFDAYMRGDKAAMSEEEVKGFNLFMGKAKCGTCHYMPLFNGNFPPRFVKTEAEVIGVPGAGRGVGGAGVGSSAGHGAGVVIDADMGRFAIVANESFRHAFKTPTVRNAAVTAPYMHNGVFGTLEEVVDFYDKGGGVGLGMKMPNQTLPFDKLELSEKEKKELVAFMKSLDSQYSF